MFNYSSTNLITFKVTYITHISLIIMIIRPSIASTGIHCTMIISALCIIKGRHQNSLPLTTNFSQKLTQPSQGISYLVGDLSRHFTKQSLPSIYYIVIRYAKQMVQMAFCDLSHTYHKQVTNVSPACFCHPTVGNFYVSPKQVETNLRSQEKCLYLQGVR